MSARAEFERFRPVDPAVLKRLTADKYGDPPTGWGPATRRRFGYYTPEEVYESVLDRLIGAGCRWLDVGCGRDPLPGNRSLAKELSERCGTLVGVDPDPAIHENPYAHVRVQGRVDEMEVSEFDVITARMVVEHVPDPGVFVTTLRRLCARNGVVVIYTVNKWAPVSIVSSLIPFPFHQRIINFLWGTGRETFPVEFERDRVAEEVRVLERVLVLEEKVVHLPELALRARCLRRFGRALRVRMRLRKRKVAEDETEIGSERPPDLLHDRIRRTTVRALVVAVFGQRHRGAVGPRPMVVRRDGRLQDSHGVSPFGVGRLDSSFSSASRIPSAPGLTSIGET